MGSTSSTEFDYAAQLQADTKQVSKVYEHGEKDEKVKCLCSSLVDAFFSECFSFQG